MTREVFVRNKLNDENKGKKKEKKGIKATDPVPVDLNPIENIPTSALYLGKKRVKKGLKSKSTCNKTDV
jgi:hypothetical protein